MFGKTTVRIARLVRTTDIVRINKQDFYVRAISFFADGRQEFRLVAVDNDQNHIDVRVEPDHAFIIVRKK